MAFLALAGCSDGSGEPFGPAADRPAVECSDDDTFDFARCPTSYPAYQCQVYVDGNRTESGDGWSWESAVRTVQEGIDRAHCGATQEGVCEQWSVWVKQGTYFIHQGCRFDSVRLRQAVGVYGGFVGDESWLHERDWLQNETILDGRDGPGGQQHVYHVARGANDATLDGITIEHGRADGPDSELGNIGAGMANGISSPTVANCTFRHNYAVWSGAGMLNYASSPIVTGCLFHDNEAAVNGGGMTNWAAKSPSSPTVSGCVFRDNHASEGGGMASLTDSAPSVTDCEFRNNTADKGGGMSLDGAFAEVSRTTFQENSATLGGGLYMKGGRLELSSSIFAGNSATSFPVSMGDGGAIFVEDATSATLDGNVFADNTATLTGGALYLSKTKEPFLIRECTFTDNSAGYSGGAVQAQGGQGTYDACLFEDNHAVRGAALAVRGGTTVINNSRFLQNSASSYGGALWLRHDGEAGAAVDMVSSVFFGNAAPLASVAQAEEMQGPLSLLHCTLAGNLSGEGSGAIRGADELRISGSVLWNPTSTEELSACGEQSLEVSHSAVRGGHPGDDNISADPLLRDLLAGDLRLADGSPCIDAADPAAAPATDLEGHGRVGAPDMGAYEHP